jgi:hypothetical protein
MVPMGVVGMERKDKCLVSKIVGARLFYSQTVHFLRGKIPERSVSKSGLPKVGETEAPLCQCPSHGKVSSYQFVIKQQYEEGGKK